MNFNNLSRMPRYEKPKKKERQKRVLKRAGKGDRGDDDSSVDSRGNLRNFIDYDYSSDDDDTSCTSVSTPVEKRTSRPQRKAKVKAQKKITKMMQKQLAQEAKCIEKKEHKKEQKKSTNKIIVPKEGRPLTSVKRPYPFKSRKEPARKRTPDSTSSESHNYTEEDQVESVEYMSEDTECMDDEDMLSTLSAEDTDDADDAEDAVNAVNAVNAANAEDADSTEDESDSEYDEDEKPKKGKDDARAGGFGGILLSFGGDPSASMKPQKYNMKKEPEIVKKFVKLLSKPAEENPIDAQITQFKQLDDVKQKELIVALENRPASADSAVNLMLKILTLKLAPDVQGMILAKYNSLQSLDTSSNEYFKLRAWLDKVVSIPFGIRKDIPVRLEDGSDKCAEFIKGARKCLDDAAYGQDESKLQILQFIATKIANPEGRGLSLLLVGPPGVGKTSLIKNGIAKALGWPFQFISLGGDSDASTYTGHQLVYESSHCGKIVNSLIASKSMSTVLMFDEVDKISQTPKGEEVMNLLIHLTDPVQNGDFEDKYLSGVPIDLSKVMFVFSANDISKIDKVLLDRMMVINLKGYDKKQKTTIAEHYLLPSALKEVNLSERVAISNDILGTIIEEYASEEKGVRELKRGIEQITQKVNMLRMYNAPELPFYIKDFTLPFIVKKEHLKLFIKKKENSDVPPEGMYC